MLLARSSRRTSAFTLIELLTVMAVVAILVGLSVGMLRGGKQRAALARARAELAALTQALEAYKLHYGDYPQTGNSAQAPITVGAVITLAQAQSQLFNALSGVYGPANFSTRLNGPVLVEISKLKLEVEPDDVRMRNIYGTAQGTPPLKQAIANAFIDPWGNRYRYYYKAAPAPSGTSTSAWRLPGYLLYSAGPDGQDTPPNGTTGLFTNTTLQFTGLNADNVYATP
jgi:prepilin-type N-terminal cleavage/methylation domain-containing protein